MNLDELPWEPYELGYYPDGMFRAVLRPDLSIYKFSDADGVRYSFREGRWGGQVRWRNLDALAAQCVLYHLLGL